MTPMLLALAPIQIHFHNFIILIHLKISIEHNPELIQKSNNNRKKKSQGNKRITSL